MQAVLVLEDGRIFRGKSFGAQGEAAGEVVFNTSLTGYQEIFTDPSYAGQIVVLTNPHIGNYGTTPADAEAKHPYIEGLVTREFSPISSNWRSTEVADEYLERNGVPVIAEVDTRAVVRHLRSNGVMRGVIASGDSLDTEALVAKTRAIKKMEGTDLATMVSTKAAYRWDSEEPRNQTGDSLLGAMVETSEPMHVVAYDFGIKENILRMLTREGCRVTVVPARTSAEDVLAMEPDGIFFSNGPGDPEPLDYAVRNIQDLQGKAPMFGICLGHQLFGLALGGKTYKLKFGHHGGNHPIKNLQTDKVEITSQNHNFAVDPETLDSASVAVTHVNLNDGTCAGLKHRSDPMFSVQYHPEASPGPHDSHYLFRDFRTMMEDWKK
jgi:carbamoyl-phosphate synthase small subunit